MGHPLEAAELRARIVVNIVLSHSRCPRWIED